MAKSRRQLSLDAQYFGGLALVFLIGAIVGIFAGNATMALLGFVAAGLNGLIAWRKRQHAKDTE